jgi:hypothetical protein
MNTPNGYNDGEDARQLARDASIAKKWGQHRAKLTPELAVEQSADEPLPPQARGYPRRAKQLVRACAYLQKMFGQLPFALSVPWVQRMLDCDYLTASMFRDKLVADGLLRLARRGGRDEATDIPRAHCYVYTPLVDGSADLDDDEREWLEGDAA